MKNKKLVLPNPEGAKKLKEDRKKDTAKAVQAFVKEMEQFPVVPPVIEGHDLFLAYNHLLNRSAKCAANFEFKTQEDIAKLTCTAVGEENLIKAAEEVAAAVNKLANRGFVRGFLTKLLAIKLHSEPYEEDKWAVVSFPVLTPAGHLFLKRTNWGVIVQENQDLSFFEIRT